MVNFVKIRVPYMQLLQASIINDETFQWPWSVLDPAMEEPSKAQGFMK